MEIGNAVASAKIGRRIARAGWNGKGMWLYYVPAASYPAQTEVAKAAYPDGMVPYRDYMAMRCVDGQVVPWLCSQSDLLANDWYELD